MSLKTCVYIFNKSSLSLSTKSLNDNISNGISFWDISEFLKKSFDYNQIQNKFETESAVFVDLIPIRSLDGLNNNYVSIILSKNQILLVALDTSYSFVEDEYIGYKNQITKVN